MSEPTFKSKKKVTNIETAEWAPDQVVRWAQEEVDSGDVDRIVVLIEYKADKEKRPLFDFVFSKSMRMELWYMAGWFYSALKRRYFE